MNTRLVIIVVAASMLAGCRAGMRLYPVKGPLAEQTPMPVFTGKITQTRPSSGKISLYLAGGELFTGNWKQVNPAPGASGQRTTDALAADGMSSVWDAIYGPGFYVAHVLGAREHGASHMTGNRHTMLDVEFISREREHGISIEKDTVKGVARDSKGNVYKVVFTS